MIRHICNACGEELESPDTLAGEKRPCPVCASMVDVPQAEAKPAAADTEPLDLDRVLREDPVPAEVAAPREPEAERKFRSCFLCYDDASEFSWIGFHSASPLVMFLGPIAAPGRWVNVRARCCQRCKNKAFTVKALAVLIGIVVAFALPLVFCCVFTVPFGRSLEHDPDGRPGSPKAIIFAIVGITLPCLVFAFLVFGAHSWRIQTLRGMVGTYSRELLEDRFGVKRIHDIRFKGNPVRGEDFLDLSEDEQRP
jgi:hypothetical protein